MAWRVHIILCPGEINIWEERRERQGKKKEKTEGIDVTLHRRSRCVYASRAWLLVVCVVMCKLHDDRWWPKSGECRRVFELVSVLVFFIYFFFILFFFIFVISSALIHSTTSSSWLGEPNFLLSLYSTVPCCLCNSSTPILLFFYSPFSFPIVIDWLAMALRQDCMSDSMHLQFSSFHFYFSPVCSVVCCWKGWQFGRSFPIRMESK